MSSPSLIQDGLKSFSTPIAKPPPLSPFSESLVLCSSYQVKYLQLGVFILPALPILVSWKNNTVGFSVNITCSRDSSFFKSPSTLFPNSFNLKDSLFLRFLLILFSLLLFLFSLLSPPSSSFSSSSSSFSSLTDSPGNPSRAWTCLGSGAVPGLGSSALSNLGAADWYRVLQNPPPWTETSFPHPSGPWEGWSPRPPGEHTYTLVSSYIHNHYGTTWILL